ncbi:MAG: hypothetical protein OEV87_04690 [Phycisphaerae bacterium]|nr:hypothetical protein [Phycisphaerae bacterium]
MKLDSKTSTQSKYPQILSFSNPETWKFGNSLNHKNPFGKNGQNILYADGEMAFTQSPNKGINNDNIYTFWSTEENPTEQDIQGGTAPTSRSPENDAKCKNDSFLAI